MYNELIKKIDLSIATYGEVRSEEYHIAILPWGATEPHNLHLPYLTDCLLSRSIAIEAAQIAWTQGVHCMVLPTVPFGAQNPGQRELPFCIHSRYATQYAILGDIVESLYAQGLRKLVLINGHGGNNFKNMIRDLSVDYPDFVILTGEWFKAARPADYFDEPGDHADELETSVMMHYHPDLTNIEDAGDGHARGWALPSLNKGFAWMPRHWEKVTDDTGIGNPRQSTPQKGEAFASACAKEWAQLLVEIANTNNYYTE